MSSIANSKSHPYAATPCRDRSVAERLQQAFLELWYIRDDKTTEEPLASYVGAEIRQPISWLLQPTTVMLAMSDFEDYPGRFDSARHLVDVVEQVFGSSVQQMILNLVYRPDNTFAQMYWSSSRNHTEVMEHREITCVVIEDQIPTQNYVLMKSGIRQNVHVSEYPTHPYREPDRTKLEQLAYHIQWHQEILDAAKKKLPRLENIKLHLTTYCWDEKVFTGFNAAIKNGGMWVKWSDYELAMEHSFD